MKSSAFLFVSFMFCSQAVPAFAGDADALYKTKCALCHGKDRKGSPAMARTFKVEPEAMDLTKHIQHHSDADLAKVISDGRGKMAAFKGKLTGEEISALVAYLKGAQSGAAAAKEDAQAENPLFKANCAVCHGKDKKGNAGMAKMFKVEPAAMDLTNTATQAKSDEELFKIISDGKGKMLSYKSKLAEARIKELVRFIKPAVIKKEPETIEAVKSGAAEVQASTSPVQAAPAAQ